MLLHYVLVAMATYSSNKSQETENITDKQSTETNSKEMLELNPLDHVTEGEQLAQAVRDLDWSDIDRIGKKYNASSFRNRVLRAIDSPLGITAIGFACAGVFIAVFEYMKR